MVEMQFADFVTEGFNQIVNNLAKAHWRWGQQADVVVRMPTGAELLQAAVDHVEKTERLRGQEPWRAIQTQVKLLIAMGMSDRARVAIEQRAGPHFKLWYHFGERADLWELLGEPEKAAADRAEADRLYAEQRRR